MLTWMVAAAAAVVLVIGVFLACQANLAQSAVSRQADATASTMLTHSATARAHGIFIGPSQPVPSVGNVERRHRPKGSG